MRSKTLLTISAILFLGISNSAPLKAAELFEKVFVPASTFIVPREQAPLVAPPSNTANDSEKADSSDTAVPPGTGGPAASGIAWPANDRAFKAMSLDQRRVIWKEIREVRKDREQPTTRGPWYTIESREDRIARAASDAQYAFIVAQGMSMMQPGRGGNDDAERGAKAVIATGAATVLIKKTMRRRRPYPNDHKFGSFPSGHTSTVFAMATVFSSAQPQQRIMALGAAGLVGWSRVKVRAHHWDDVLIGGTLGYMIGRHFAPDSPSPQRQNFPVASVRFTF